MESKNDGLHRIGSDKLILNTLATSMAIAGPYANIIYGNMSFGKQRPRDKSKYIQHLSCSVCGAYGRITLCNDKNGNKICINCKKKKRSETV